MSGFQDFGFGDGDDALITKGERLKMSNNETIRVSFLWWPGLEEGKPDLSAKTPKFVGAPRHYMQGVGYFINQGEEYTKLAGEAPKLRINTIIVKWPTKKNGQIDTEELKAGGAEVMYWVFDPKKYDSLKPYHMDFPFGSHDIRITCTDQNFQAMSFSPCQDSMLAKLAEKPENAVYQSIIKQGKALVSGARDEIGRTMTLSELRSNLSAGSPGVSGDTVSAAVVDDIDSELEGLLS